MRLCAVLQRKIIDLEKVYRDIYLFLYLFCCVSIGQAGRKAESRVCVCDKKRITQLRKIAVFVQRVSFDEKFLWSRWLGVRKEEPASKKSCCCGSESEVIALFETVAIGIVAVSTESDHPTSGHQRRRRFQFGWTPRAETPNSTSAPTIRTQHNFRQPKHENGVVTTAARGAVSVSRLHCVYINCKVCQEVEWCDARPELRDVEGSISSVQSVQADVRPAFSRRKIQKPFQIYCTTPNWESESRIAKNIARHTASPVPYRKCCFYKLCFLNSLEPPSSDMTPYNSDVDDDGVFHL